MHEEVYLLGYNALQVPRYIAELFITTAVSTSNPTTGLFFILGAGVEPSSLLLRSFIGLLCQHWMTDGDDCAAIGAMNEWQGKP
jgi:hypothetical protein